MSSKKFEGTPTSIEGLFTVTYKEFPDDRGSVMEFYRESDFLESGLPSLGQRPQINAPLTTKGALRGIHAESAHKFVAVASGEVYAAIVDLRPDSQTVGEWIGFTLSRGMGLFISSGLGNSFQSISPEPSVYLYMFGEEWKPDMPGTSCDPLDPELGIPWPIPNGEGMIISDKDRRNPSFKEAIK